jgi:hypothetical protein
MLGGARLAAIIARRAGRLTVPRPFCLSPSGIERPLQQVAFGAPTHLSHPRRHSALAAGALRVLQRQAQFLGQALHSRALALPRTVRLEPQRPDASIPGRNHSAD